MWAGATFQTSASSYSTSLLSFPDKPTDKNNTDLHHIGDKDCICSLLLPLREVIEVDGGRASCRTQTPEATVLSPDFGLRLGLRNKSTLGKVWEISKYLLFFQLNVPENK